MTTQPQQVFRKNQTPLGLLSIDARLLYDRLCQCAIGDLVTYADLSLLINRNVQEIARSLLRTARDKALRDHRLVFGVVRDIGLKRLNDVEIVGTGQDTCDRIRRASRRGRRKILASDPRQVSRDMNLRRSAYLAALGTVEHFAGDNTIKKLETAAARKQQELPAGVSLDQLKAYR